MLCISSNHVSLPLGQNRDFSNLSGNLPQQNVPYSANNGTSLPISYGGSSGTDIGSLYGDINGNEQQRLQSATSATLMQLIIQLLPQILQQALQQLTNDHNCEPQTQLLGSLSEPEVTPPFSAEEPINQPVTGTTETTLPTPGSSRLHLPDALKPYEEDIQKAADKTGVPAEMLAAQIWQESRGSLDANTMNSGNGLQDSGLMQVNSNTFADLQSKNPELLGPNADPNCPRDNIMAGALYMKEQLNTFDGNMGAALRAYNSGPNNVNLNDLSDISKTGTGDATYIDKVLNFANIIKTGQGELPA